MNALNTFIKAGVNEQDRVTAIEDCITGWDDTVTIETIQQGMMARLNALGKNVTGIAISRSNLHTVEIAFSNEKGVMPELGMFVGTTMDHISTDYFHPEEIRKISKCLLAEFHH